MRLVSCPLTYYDFMERLRDSVLITEPYFQLVRIISAIEDGFRGFEEREGLRGGAA